MHLTIVLSVINFLSSLLIINNHSAGSQSREYNLKKSEYYTEPLTSWAKQNNVLQKNIKT